MYQGNVEQEKNKENLETGTRTDTCGNIKEKFQ